MAESGGYGAGTCEKAVKEHSMVDATKVATPVTVYWRPGCSSCATLRRGLRSSGVVFREVNIWDEPTAAATVRALANGAEIVPTVVVGTIGLVNPSTARVLAALSGAPATAIRRSAERNRAPRRLVVGVILSASLLVDLLGQHTVSWVFDGVALSIYVTWRVVERWTSRRS